MGLQGHSHTLHLLYAASTWLAVVLTFPGQVRKKLKWCPDCSTPSPAALTTEVQDPSWTSSPVYGAGWDLSKYFFLGGEATLSLLPPPAQKCQSQLAVVDSWLKSILTRQTDSGLAFMTGTRVRTVCRAECGLSAPCNCGSSGYKPGRFAHSLLRDPGELPTAFWG